MSARLRTIAACHDAAAKEAARRQDVQSREAFAQYRFDIERARMNARLERPKGEPSIWTGICLVLIPLVSWSLVLVATGVWK